MPYSKTEEMVEAFPDVYTIHKDQTLEINKALAENAIGRQRKCMQGG